MTVSAGSADHTAAPASGAALVVGVGARRGVAGEEVSALIEQVLRTAGLAVSDVVELATVEAKTVEPGIVAAAARLGVPLRGRSAAELTRVPVPGASEEVGALVGTPSVAEAAALCAADELVVPKTKSARVTCAVARQIGRAHV